MFPKKITRPKRPSRVTLDKLLSKVVRMLAGGVCFICGREGSQACHIFSKKAYPKSRYDFRLNAIWGCFTCHKGGNHSMHEDPEWFRDWYDKKFGEGAMDNLKMIVSIRETTSEKLDPIMVKIELEQVLKDGKI